jgi:uncharacterized protein (DUF58 family)
MREALFAMTTRGRAFVAAGVTALVCALVLGQDDLVRVGSLLLLLPVVTAYFLGRSRYRLGLVRSVTPGQVTAGREARVQLALTNDGRLPTGLLLLEDHLPYVLGTRPRFVLDRMAPRHRRAVSYVVRSDLRGRFTIGPLAVRLRDPFGLVELQRRFTSTASLVVVPRVLPLPPIPLTGAWTGSGDNRPRAFASGSAEDVTVREYRRGDDLRRVHWRSSARVGDLMVRREEQPWQSRATLFLDNRQVAHRGRGAASSLEHAVTAAASVAVHLVQRGFLVRLVTATGEEQGGSWHERGGAGQSGPLLEQLAVVTASGRPDLDTRWLQDPGRSGLLVAVVGAVGDHDQAAFARMRHTAANAMAVVLDAEAWNGATHSLRGEPGGAARSLRGEPQGAGRLRAQGWQAVAAGPGSPLGAVWQELGLSRGLAARPTRDGLVLGSTP